MAGTEANVKVRLDTRQARGDLRGLTKDAARTAGRVGQGIRGAVGRGLGAVGLGGGIGVGLAAVRGATQSSASDIITETLAPFGARLERAVFGDLSIEARAKKHAKEEFIQSFGFVVPEKGPIPNSLKNIFNQMVAIRERHEQGARNIRTDPFFGLKPPDVEKFIDQAVKGLGGLMIEIAADATTRFLQFVNSK